MGDAKARNILLVSPHGETEELWSTGSESPEVRSLFPPLALATIAALTPPDRYRVRIWDELVHGKIEERTRFGHDIDLVGITGYRQHLPRCRSLAALFRSRGIPVAIGGPGISGAPYDHRDAFDVLFINEAERTWPRFLADWESGRGYRDEYRQIEKPDLGESPAPAWDGIAGDMRRYATGNVQTTRGCPFDCDFCDVVYLYGRRPRHKPVERVLEEVARLESFGFRSIFFSDDEFCGDRAYARELLRKLIPLNASFRVPLAFSTQMGMSVARDEELLRLMAEAGFELAFVGVETPSEESLGEVNKAGNLRGDLLGDIRRIQSYGIGMRAGMIVGFDHDTEEIFDRQYRFIQDACLTSVGINMLKAPLGTKLWTRMMREGRVYDMSLNRGLGSPRTYTNIRPARMSRVGLLEGYRRLMERVYSWDAFRERVCGFVSLVRPPWNEDGRVAPEEEASLLRSLTEGEEGAGEAVERIVAHTLATAPGMMRKVRTIVLQHRNYCRSIREVLPQIRRQADLERSGRIVLEPDRRALPPPESFRAAFHRAFPEIHRRAAAALGDADALPAVLTEVFVDFLVRWGHELSGLESHHVEYVRELCDRACAKRGGKGAGAAPHPDPSGAVAQGAELRQLADDVFKNVWVDLSGLHAGRRRRDA